MKNELRESIDGSALELLPVCGFLCGGAHQIVGIPLTSIFCPSTASMFPLELLVMIPIPVVILTGTHTRINVSNAEPTILSHNSFFMFNCVFHEKTIDSH